MKKSLLLWFVFQYPLLFCIAQKQGKEHIDSLRGVLTGQIHDTTRVKLLTDICYEYYFINPDEGVKYGKQGLELAEKIKWKKGIAYADGKIGICYWAVSDFPKALEYLFNALKISEDLKDSIGISNNLGNIGVTYWSQNDFSSALQCYSKCLKIDEALGRKKDIGYDYSYMGTSYGKLENYPKALESFQKALKIFEEQGDRMNISRSFGNMGVVYGSLSDNAKALEYDFKALAIARELGNKQDLSSLLGNIGDRYLHIASDADQSQVLKTLFGGNKAEALKQAKLYLDSSTTIRKELNDLYGLQDTYKNLSNAEELLGNDRAALEQYKKYTAAKDSVYNSDNEKKITRLQMQYEFDKKESAIKAEQEKQKITRNYIFTGMGIVVLFLLIMLIQRNRIAAERRKIALEQERMRISRDLHDDLGSGLTGILMMSEQLGDSHSGETANKNIKRIKESSRQMVDQMGEIVWAMNSKNDTLENLIGYLNTYTRDYFENVNISQKITMPEKIPHKMMSGMLRRNVFLVVKESLNNITKHAQATEVTLKIETANGTMNIELTDNGKGFKMGETRRFGNGLKNMKSRMEDINGSYSIESNDGQGTKTVIVCPLS